MILQTTFLTGNRTIKLIKEDLHYIGLEMNPDGYGMYGVITVSERNKDDDPHYRKVDKETMLSILEALRQDISDDPGDHQAGHMGPFYDRVIDTSNQLITKVYFINLDLCPVLSANVDKSLCGMERLHVEFEDLAFDIYSTDECYRDFKTRLQFID